MRPHTPGCYDTRQRVLAYYQDVRHRLKAPHRFLAVLATAFAPSTALSYANVARSLIPELRDDPLTKEACLFLQKRLAQAKLKKATPISPAQVALVIRSAPPTTAATILWMWIGAARHADLKPAHVESWKRLGQLPVVCLRFGPWKSDPTGKREASKVLPVNPLLKSLLKKRAFSSFAQVKVALKKIDPTLSVHSIRRGAIKALSMEHSADEIAVLTQHAAGQTRSQAHKYAPLSATGPTPSLQLMLASKLWKMLSSRTAPLPPEWSYGAQILG